MTPQEMRLEPLPYPIPCYGWFLKGYVERIRTGCTFSEQFHKTWCFLWDKNTGIQELV